MRLKKWPNVAFFGNQHVQNSQTSKFVCQREREPVVQPNSPQKNETYSLCLERERRRGVPYFFNCRGFTSSISQTTENIKK